MDSQETQVTEALKSMGFEEALIKTAYASAPIKTAEGVINRIEEMQSGKEDPSPRYI